MAKIVNWVKHNRKEFWILVFILAVAAFCRLYKIDQYMTFLGDEGRDVIVVRRIFTELHPPLIGPGTSVGNMYLGPLYYYMMAPALLLADFSPVGPAVLVAVLGVITVGFVWWVGREWFPAKDGQGRISWAGLIAAGLYAISPTVIIYSHSSWNPNIMPFFALLSVYSIWRVWKNREYKWLIVLGVAYAFVLQSHYLGLLLAPTLLIFWYLSRAPKRYALYAASIFVVLMSPLLIFDLRHNFMNAKALYTLIASHDGTVSISVRQLITKIPGVLNQINVSLVGGSNLVIGEIVSMVFLIVLMALIYINVVKRRSLKKVNPAVYLLFSWLFFGLIGFAFYKLPIYDHYFGFLFPVPFLIIGAVGQSIQSNKNLLAKIVFYVFCFGLVAVNLLNNPLRYAPNKQLARSQDVSKFILGKAQGQPFDLAVLAERNYEDGYRYFLELWGGTVMHADRWDQKTIVNQLFVVCELEEKKCDPTHSSKAEVANFGMSKVEDWWEVAGVNIYKLSHRL
jgi:4-amino-4-deoxy-L-arabinose transferase-like glycosyltransferase